MGRIFISTSPMAPHRKLPRGCHSCSTPLSHSERRRPTSPWVRNRRRNAPGFHRRSVESSSLSMAPSCAFPEARCRGPVQTADRQFTDSSSRLQLANARTHPVTRPRSRLPRRRAVRVAVDGAAGGLAIQASRRAAASRCIASVAPIDRLRLVPDDRHGDRSRHASTLERPDGGPAHVMHQRTGTPSGLAGVPPRRPEVADALAVPMEDNGQIVPAALSFS